MAECLHNGSTFKHHCFEWQSKEDMIDKSNTNSHIKKVVVVVSGKGGVGKLSVTSMLAVAVRKNGLKNVVSDADITETLLPKTFGVTQKRWATATAFFPPKRIWGLKSCPSTCCWTD